MVTAMKRASGLVTDEGGMTSHAAIVSRELQVPAVVGTGDGTQVIEDGNPSGSTDQPASSRRPPKRGQTRPSQRPEPSRPSVTPPTNSPR